MSDNTPDMVTNKKFNILGVNHIGIAAKDPARCKHFFKDILGLPLEGVELVAEQSTLTTMYPARNVPSGPSHVTRLEVVEPHEGQGPIAKYLEKKGGGIHHVALHVDDCAAAVAQLKALGVKMVDEVPRVGAHQTLIAFVHPESTGGILLELVQETK